MVIPGELGLSSNVPSSSVYMVSLSHSFLDIPGKFAKCPESLTKLVKSALEVICRLLEWKSKTLVQHLAK